MLSCRYGDRAGFPCVFLPPTVGKCHSPVVDPDQEAQLSSRPWSARRPQNLFLSAIFIVVAAALVWQAFDYIGRGLGGAIPYLLIVGGPLLAGYYVWYFNIRDFEGEQTPQTPSS